MRRERHEQNDRETAEMAENQLLPSVKHWPSLTEMSSMTAE